MGPICLIPQVLTDLGFNPTAICDEIGVDRGYFDDRERLISYGEAGQLLAALAARTGCGHFGLLVGRRNGLAQLGLIGRVAAVSNDVETALRVIIRYFAIFDRGAVMSLRSIGEEASIVFGIISAGITGGDQLCDVALSITVNVLKELCGGNWRPNLATFPHKSPPDALAFKAHFGAKTRFDADEAAISFDRIWLRRPVSDATVADRMTLLDRAAAAESLLDVTSADRVRGELRAALPICWLDEAQIAKRLGLSARRLREVLVAESASFRAIVDELRFETARQFLATSQLELREIALLLGYSDATAFNRAFRRWSGEPPSAWRAKSRLLPAISKITGPALKGAGLGGEFDAAKGESTRTRLA